MDESPFKGFTRRTRLTGVSFELIVARVRFQSELRDQSDEHSDLSQSLDFTVFNFERF